MPILYHSWFLVGILIVMCSCRDLPYEIALNCFDQPFQSTVFYSGPLQGKGKLAIRESKTNRGKLDIKGFIYLDSVQNRATSNKPDILLDGSGVCFKGVVKARITVDFGNHELYEPVGGRLTAVLTPDFASTPFGSLEVAVLQKSITIDREEREIMLAGTWRSILE